MRIPGFQGIIKNAIGFVDFRDIPDQRTQGIVRSDVVPISLRIGNEQLLMFWNANIDG
jgi:hypothetical protein